MAVFLKVDLSKPLDDLKEVAKLIFDEVHRIEVDSDLDYKESDYENYFDLFHVNDVNNGKLVAGVDVELVHQQYDFNTETLYGFYQVVCACGKDTMWEDFEEVAKTFNKK